MAHHGPNMALARFCNLSIVLACPLDQVDSVFQNIYCPKFKVFKGLGLSPELCQSN